MSYVLLKNGKIKKLKNKKYKKSKVDSYFIESYTDVLGTYYKRYSPDTYKLLLKLKDCKLSYDFLDGSAVDDEEAEDLLVHYKFKYDSAFDLLSKLDEVFISENILNDTFWIYDSFYAYIFMNMKISTSKDGKKRKFIHPIDFLKYTKTDRDILKYRYSSGSILELSDKKYNEYSRNNKKFRSTISDGSSYFTQVYSDIYIRTNPKFYTKIKSLFIKTKITLEDEYSDIHFKNSYDLEYHRSHKNKLYNNSSELKVFNNSRSSILYERYLFPSVIESLERYNYIRYKVKTNIENINGNDTKISFKKFFNKYFKVNGGN